MNIEKPPFPWSILKNLLEIFAKVSGRWDYPRDTEGDFPTMNLADKLHWLYKFYHPLIRAQKGLGIEEHFIRRRPEKLSLPDGFVAEQSISLSAVGDLIQNPRLEERGSDLYESVGKAIFGSHISLANLESPLTDKPQARLSLDRKKAPLLCLPIKQFQTLKGWKKNNYTVMSVATNHSLDFGGKCFKKTLETLDAENIRWVGANLLPCSERRGLILERSGIKVGIIATTFGLNGHLPPEVHANIVNVDPLNKRGQVEVPLALARQIEQCKQEKCDIIIASLHWGLEGEFFPLRRQINLAHRIVHLGVDIIIGHHPHVIQPVELYEPENERYRKALIFYSLGNLTHPFNLPHFALSLLAQIEVIKGKLAGKRKTFINNVQAIPLLFRHSNNSAELNFLRCLPTEDDFVKRASFYADLALGKQ